MIVTPCWGLFVMTGMDGVLAVKRRGGEKSRKKDEQENKKRVEERDRDVH